tara:strand:- start:312 stop:884 length:573 start_codon:yes stop_codon:yes gene_type:complete
MTRVGNRITTVTTKTGDDGKTKLADGSSVQKSGKRINAIGDIDELNSMIGLLVTEIEDATIKTICAQVQQELFDIGGSLATKGLVPSPEFVWIEELLADLNQTLPPLKEFVIPGGTKSAALAHVCRTICRRAERSIWQLDKPNKADQETKTIENNLGRYLNRLSDLFFLLARTLNQSEGSEIQWRGTQEH